MLRCAHHWAWRLFTRTRYFKTLFIFISNSVRLMSFTKMVFFRDFAPANISIWLFLKANVLDNSLMQASLAAPRTGKTVILILSAPSCIPAISAREARGTT